MKKILSLFLSVIMLFSITAGIDFSSFADDEGTIVSGDHEHIYNEFVVQAPTCSSEGVKYLLCTGCDREKTESIPKLPHTEVIDEGVPATCISTGLTQGSHCSECNEVITAQETIPAAEHSYDDGIITKEATCATDGEKTYTCTVCQATKTEIFKATGHSYDNGVITKEPTCTTDGTKIYTCADCKATKTETIKAAGHKYDSGKVTKKATCTANGVKTYTCTVCKAAKTETIKATGHKAVKDKAVKATYVSAGKTEGSHCSVCKKVIKAQKTVAKLKLAKPSSVKISAVSKGFKLTWKKAKDSSGYQIQYSTSSKFKSAKTVTVNSKTTSKTVKKLKAKKKYYVRIRTYKTVKVNGKNKKVYSNWVSKSVKTKK